MSEESLNAPVSIQADSSEIMQQRLHELRAQLQPGKKDDEAKVRKACQDFEAVFIGQLWKQMRDSVPKDGLLHSKEEENYLSMFDQELSVKMARSGGIGLSDMLYASLKDRLQNASKDTSSPKPLLPLDGTAQAATPLNTAKEAPTLAALTVRHQAEMLARSIEQAHNPTLPEEKLSSVRSTIPELEDALGVKGRTGGI